MIQDKYKDANILIFGNADSLLRQGREIPRCWDIVRLNRGSPRQKEMYLGHWTSVLATSTPLDIGYVEREYGGNIDLMWCTPSNRAITPFWEKQERYPRDRWEILHELLGARPSTGMMAIDYFYHIVKPYRMAIVGFDWYESPTWYWEEEARARGPAEAHDFEREKRFIQNFYRGLEIWEK